MSVRYSPKILIVLVEDNWVVREMAKHLKLVTIYNKSIVKS